VDLIIKSTGTGTILGGQALKKEANVQLAPACMMEIFM
jgi:hypothetical protein